MAIVVEKVEISPNPVPVTKNLFGKRFHEGFINLSTGVIQSQGEGPYPDSLYGDPIRARKGKNYIASGFSKDFRYRLFRLDGDYHGGVGNGKVLINCPEDGYFIPLFYAGIAENEKSTVQIEEGTNATGYSEPVQIKISATIVTHGYLGQSTHQKLKEYTHGQLKARGTTE